MNSNQPQPNKFKYQLEIRGVETDVLFSTPDGWLKTNIKYGRSKIYGGVIRALTLPIKYVHHGASLVRREFYKYGLTALLNQRILTNDPLTFEDRQLFFGKLDFKNWSDEPTGVTVNLSENNINTQVSAKSEQQYTIPLTVSSLRRQSWIDTRGYDPMVDILLTPLKLQESADIIFSTSPDFRMNAFFQLGIADYQQMSVNPSVKGTGFLQQAPPVFTGNPNYFFWAQTDTKMRISSPLDPITGLPVSSGVQTSINGGPGGIPAQYEYNIYDETGALVKTLATSGIVNSTVEFPFSFDFSITVTKGTKLFFYIRNALQPLADYGTDHGVNMQTGTMRLTYFTSTDATHCQALRPAYIFDYLVQKMNGTDNPAVVTQSRLLDGLLKNACITCSNSIQAPQQTNIYQAGDNLQYGASYKVLGGIIHYFNSDGHAQDYSPGQVIKAILPYNTFTTDLDQDGFVQQIDSNPQILISFTQFFKSIYAVMGAQLGVGIDPTAQGKYCMEDLRYFYRQTPSNATSNMAALDLGINIDIKSPRLETATDIIINNIKAGYNDPQLTALNGGKEVNSGVRYGTLVDVTNNTLEIISPIHASPYQIEEKRIQPGQDRPSNGLSGSFYLNSAASRSDNDNHFVWVENSPVSGHDWYIPLTVANGCTSYSGVDADYYNWKLSPKQNVMRGANYLASIFDKMQGYSIFITGADKNISMITVDLDGNRVAEGEDIAIANLGTQIFLPYYDNIVTGLQFNAEQMLSISPFGEVWYKYRNVYWKGFIQEVSVDLGSNTPQQFKVLLTPVNDLSLRVF